MKTLYIIAGPNGAGKTTASITMLPEIFWLPKPEIAVERVKQRVLEGGHSIPEDVILRRYHAGIDNFFKIFMERVDSWMLVENYSVPRIIIASGGKKASLRIDNEELYKRVKKYVR